MRLSTLIFLLFFIAYGALQLGSDFPARLVWWMLIVAAIVRIVEDLIFAVTIPTVRRRAVAAPAE